MSCPYNSLFFVERWNDGMMECCRKGEREKGRKGEGEKGRRGED
jgi:hypothetical protein